jgi:peptidoglycan-N-acetylglucosamine deacetylase
MLLNPWAVTIPAACVAGGAGLFARAAVAPSSQIFGPVLRRLPEREAGNRIALTFDDGPNPSVTPQILDLCARHHARATFFVMGRFARECPSLVREISCAGHVLGNHTTTHPNLIFKTQAQIANELRACREAVFDALGAADPAQMAWLRPPFGFRGPQLHRVAENFAPAGVATWSRTAHDWKPQPAAPVIERLSRVRAGDIVLLHDGDHCLQNGDRAHVLAALEHWLPRWRDAGFQFVTIPAGVASAIS